MLNLERDFSVFFFFFFFTPYIAKGSIAQETKAADESELRNDVSSFTASDYDQKVIIRVLRVET